MALVITNNYSTGQSDSVENEDEAKKKPYCDNVL